MRERERSSPGEREEAKIERKTAGVTGIRLVLGGLVGAPALAPGPSIVLVLACALDMESGYGRCDATGGVETVGAVEYVAAAYEAGVIVLVLGVELVGVRLELALESTDGDGEATIAEFDTNIDIEVGCVSADFVQGWRPGGTEVVLVSTNNGSRADR